MVRFLKEIPYSFLLPAALVLGLAPFVPEPHLVEKVRLLFAGELARAVDVFDLVMHSTPLVLLALKFIFTAKRGA